MDKRVTKEMNISEALEIDPGIANILFASGMHCLGCMMASGESLAEAAAVHQINSDELIESINSFLAQK